MINSVSIWYGWILGRHYCPICRSALVAKQITEVLDANSREAKELESQFDGNLFGKTEYTYYILYCTSCNKEYKGKKILQYERIHKIPTVYSNKESFFYKYLRNRYCPKCKNLLRVKYDSKIVNLNANNHNLPKEEIEERTGFFYCDKCDFEILFEDMKEYEKNRKRR